MSCVRFVVLASVTFLNSISVSSVDSWPLGYLTGVGRRLPTLAEASTERDLKRYPSPDPRTSKQASCLLLEQCMSVAHITTYKMKNTWQIKLIITIQLVFKN